MFEDMLHNSANGIQMMGVINALKTGNSTIDAMLAMAVPYALSVGLSSTSRSRIVKWCNELLGTKANEQNSEERFKYHRSMTFSYSDNMSGQQQRRAGAPKRRNEDLLRAIQLFVSKNLVRVGALQEDAVIEFVEKDEDSMVTTTNSGNNSSQTRNRRGHAALETMQRCEILQTMPENAWIFVGEYGCDKRGITPHSVMLQIASKTKKLGKPSTEDDDGDDGPRFGPLPTCTTVNLQMKSTGSEAISIFLDTVFAWYLQQLQTKTQEFRYLFDTDGSVYRLSDEKTFDSLFSADCRSLANIVDHFHNKTGKYAIAGYPDVSKEKDEKWSPIHSCVVLLPH